MLLTTVCLYSLKQVWLCASQTDLTIDTPFSGITILQGDDIILSCIPSESDIALQWSYDGNDINSSPVYHFTPPFLNHDLTISNANDTDSGSYVCAFKLKNRVIVQETISLTVVPSEHDQHA